MGRWSGTLGRTLRERVRAAVRLAGRPQVDGSFEALRLNQAALALAVARLQPSAESDPWDGPVRSRIATQALCTAPTYRLWCERMGQPPVLHRKQWEWVFIADSLQRSGALVAGARGLGFGTGREPLASLFAAAGCDVLATDLDPHDARAEAWSGTGQHSGRLVSLHDPAVCDVATFEQRVAWRPVDMTNIPDELQGFDFCWSSCALEHLGSIDAGLAFIERSIATLQPGGVAVHTTELALDDRASPLREGPTVLYGRDDLDLAATRWRQAGHDVAELTLDRGEGLLDWYVDVPPFILHEPSLRVLLEGRTCTSVGLVIRRGRD
jgi:hypothetical protein